MALLALEDISLRYSERPLLDGVTFLIGERERVGIVGPNGSGKSTLLKILAGVEEPDSGQRTMQRGITVGYLEQEPEFEAGLSIGEVARSGLGQHAQVLQRLEQVHSKMASPDCSPAQLERLLAEQERLDTQLAGMGGYEVEHKVESILRAVGLPDSSAQCDVLSGGERRRVALARLLIAEPDLLLLDEPTNHLDAETIRWLEKVLLESRQALVLVTHDRYFLDRIVDRVADLDRGKLHESAGGYAEYVLARAARHGLEQQAEATRQNLLRRESEWMRRGPPARTTKSKSRIQRFEALVADAPPAPSAELQFEIPCEHRLGTKVISLHGINKAWDERTVLNSLDLEIGKGERLGIVGPNGAGKTTLLKLCMQSIQADSGKVEIGSTVAFSYLDQHRMQVDPAQTVVEAVAGSGEHVSYDGRLMRIETYLERFLFSSKMLRSKVADLSGGERNRLILAKLLAIGGNVLVLDEPTNDLDLVTLRVLEEALCAFRGSALIVSHDRWFLDRVATRILHIGSDGSWRLHAGDLSSLLETLASEQQERERRKSEAAARARTKTKTSRPARPRKSKEQKELEELPEQIDAFETSMAKLDEELAEPGLYEGEHSALESLLAERKRLEADLQTAYARWEELEAQFDGPTD